jgi:hypothetical protein
MKIEKIFFEDNLFGKTIQEWTATFNVETNLIESKSNFDIKSIDGLVVFHENHDLSKAHLDIMDLFATHQLGINKVDVNGTLSVAASSFELWIDRNKAKTILFIGEDSLVKNPNTPRFLSSIKL